MSWYLQTPDNGSPNLLATIIGECGAASQGAGAFAFASAMGVKLLTAEPDFQKFLTHSEFVAVIGLDAITDTGALEELRRVCTKYPNFKAKVFLHDRSGSCFHPKTMWLKREDGGVIITGSGNLTTGGLMANWEATAVEKLSAAQMTAAEAQWNAWIKAHNAQLFELDDPSALEKAKANKIQRTRIKKVLKLTEEEGEGAAGDVAEEVADEVAQDLSLNPVLIAEVPAAGNRWKQVNFDMGTYQQFFGVTLGKAKDVQFHHVQNDGTLGPTEDRHAVEVQSQNYRFEIAAAQGLAYPDNGHPIVIFEKIAASTFRYILLMPGEEAHTLIQNYLNANYVTIPNRKKRITITVGELQKVWPASPLFL